VSDRSKCVICRARRPWNAKKGRCTRCKELNSLLTRLHNEIPPHLTAEQEAEVRLNRLRRKVGCL
jgi:hypothetical protein